MRKISLLAGATLLLAGPAVAADLARPVYKAPAFVPGFTWTGCYAGAAIGGARANQSAGTHTDGLPNQVTVPAIEGPPTVFHLPQDDTAGNLGGSGVIGGPYVGCNYQFMSGLVLGAEGDFNWTGLSGSFDAPNSLLGFPFPSGGVSMTSDTRWVASLRARLGYAIMPNVLVYGTGGGARAATDRTGVDTFFPGGSLTMSPITTTDNGWVAGGGVEWAPWSNNWILRVEYLHYQLGGFSSSASGVINGKSTTTTFNFGDLKLDSVRAGLSYKF